jgi:hypothetical protein
MSSLRQVGNRWPSLSTCVSARPPSLALDWSRSMWCLGESVKLSEANITWIPFHLVTWIRLIHLPPPVFWLNEHVKIGQKMSLQHLAFIHNVLVVHLRRPLLAKVWCTSSRQRTTANWRNPKPDKLQQKSNTMLTCFFFFRCLTNFPPK